MTREFEVHVKCDACGKKDKVRFQCASEEVPDKTPEIARAWLEKHVREAHGYMQ